MVEEERKGGLKWLSMGSGNRIHAPSPWNTHTCDPSLGRMPAACSSTLFYIHLFISRGAKGSDSKLLTDREKDKQEPFHIEDWKMWHTRFPAAQRTARAPGSAPAE